MNMEIHKQYIHIDTTPCIHRVSYGDSRKYNWYMGNNMEWRLISCLKYVNKEMSRNIRLCHEVNK